MRRDIFENDGALLRTIGSFFDDQLDTFRLMNEQIIWRNLLYYEGEQYIEFLRSTKSFRRRSVPDFTPTPVSNDIREYVRSIKAMLLNQKMVPRVWPNTNEKEDKEAADIGESLLIWLGSANDASFMDEKEKLCIWLPISGTAFMRTYPDVDGGVWIPGGGKTGSVARECILPFNMRLDTLGDNLDKKRWIGIESLKDKEWVEDTFRVKIENVGENKTYIDYQKSLAKLIGNVSPWKGQAIISQALDTDNENLVLFREVEFQPTVQFPYGKYVSVCGGKVLQNWDRLPIISGDDEWNYSVTDFHYNYVPGRFWSSGGVNDLISPQNTVNLIDQAFAINRMGMGRPKIITPGDIGLKLIGIGGLGFVAMSYNPIMGQRPSFEQGTPLPPQVLEERRLQKEQFQDASGDPKNILRGQSPSANASGVMTQSLRETAESGKYPDIDRFNRALCRVYKKTLLVAQEVMTEERMLKVTGRGNKVKIMKFKASDLRGNTDVRLELDSGLISTKSGQVEMLVNLVQAGFFKKEDIDPTMRQELLTKLGYTSFSDETNNDVERAETENVRIASGDFSVMLAEPDPKTGEDVVIVNDPLFKYDNHMEHYDAHRKYIISPEFKELPGEAKQVLIAHTDLHQKLISEKKPDIREYVQVDKIFPFLTASERGQVLQDIGITPGEETEVGMPDANVVVKSKEKIMNTELKEANKQDKADVDIMQKDKAMNLDLLKHTMTEAGKARAIQTKAVQNRGEGSQPRTP